MPSLVEISLAAEGASKMHSLSENDSPPSQGSPVTGTASDGRDSPRSPTPERDYLSNRKIPMVVPAQGLLLEQEWERGLQSQGELMHQVATTLCRTESDIHIPHLLTVRGGNNVGSMMAAESSTSERYVCSRILNPLNQSAGHTLHRKTTDATSFLISERSLMPSTSQRNESGDSLQSSSPERMCSDMALCPQSALDGIPSSSERIYLPSLIQRYQGTLHSPSERLHMPSNSQRLYPQNSVMPMDEFPS